MTTMTIIFDISKIRLIRCCSLIIIIIIALLSDAISSDESGPTSYSEYYTKSSTSTLPNTIKKTKKKNTKTKKQGGDAIHVTSSIATISVLIDQHPSTTSSRATSHFLAQTDNGFWKQRVRKQLALVQYRLLFRSDFYPNEETDSRNQLLLPDFKQFKVHFMDKKPKVMTIDGHKHVGRRYSFETHIIGKAGSAALADPALAVIGRNTNESFVLPADPHLLVQRTGFACMDESGFPAGSIDSEAPEVYYDDSCDVETPDGPVDVTCQQCHCSMHVTESCIDALHRHVGAIRLILTFTRVKFTNQLAEHYEKLNDFHIQETATGANLVGLRDRISGLSHNFVVYKYFKAHSCERIECLEGSGWRRLVLFDSTHVNVGSKNLDIFDLNYTIGDESSFNVSKFHYLYYWDPCHHHPHFSAYASFAIGTSKGRKQGFCIQTTGRNINSRNVSIVTPYASCVRQGVSPGWSDSYNVGLPCQWVDITKLSSPTSTTLTVTVNPKNWLCEGTKLNGFVPTGETTQLPLYTVAGQSIDKWRCQTSPGALKDNTDIVPIKIPGPGKGALTSKCFDAEQVYGPLRDCEFKLSHPFQACTKPGATVQLSCTLPHGAKPQVVRLCEASIAFKTGTACRIMDKFTIVKYMDKFTLANEVVTDAAPTRFNFTCPKPRDEIETGGYYATYTGAVLNGVDASAPVTCVVVQ